MPTSAQNKATAKYIKTHMRRFTLQCNKETDADVIAYLEASGNYNKLLKQMIRDKIEKEGGTS